MAINQPRTRLVNFRLSAEEYDRLKDACGTNHSRSVSEFARSAVLSKFLPAPPPAFEDSLTAVNSKVNELENNLHTLMRQMGLISNPMAIARISGGLASNASPQARKE